MTLWNVTVKQTFTTEREEVFEVDADSEEEAKSIALEEAIGDARAGLAFLPDIDTEGEPFYEVIDVN